MEIFICFTSPLVWPTFYLPMTVFETFLTIEILLPSDCFILQF